MDSKSRKMETLPSGDEPEETLANEEGRKPLSRYRRLAKICIAVLAGLYYIAQEVLNTML